MNDQSQSDFKEAVTVSEMARMCRLSRQRFHELIGTVFPIPVYLLSNGRPVYLRKQQEECLKVRRTGRAYYTGNPVIFYNRRSKKQRRKSETAGAEPNNNGLLTGLKSLGLDDVTEGDVDSTVHELFPNGTEKVDRGELIRTVFLRLKRKQAV